MKSLAELRASKDAAPSLPTRSSKICLDQEVLAKIQRLTAEKQDLRVEALRAGSDDQDGPPQRLANADPPRVAEISAEIEALYGQMRESEGDLLLRAIPGGDWQRWKDNHPAREGNQSDNEIAFGFCNATDLLDALEKFVVGWNGEDFGPGEWNTWFKNKVAPADLRDLCSQVVQMHETRISVPKSSAASSGNPTSATD